MKILCLALAGFLVFTGISKADSGISKEEVKERISRYEMMIDSALYYGSDCVYEIRVSSTLIEENCTTFQKITKKILKMVDEMTPVFNYLDHTELYGMKLRRTFLLDKIGELESMAKKLSFEWDMKK